MGIKMAHAVIQSDQELSYVQGHLEQDSVQLLEHQKKADLDNAALQGELDAVAALNQSVTEAQNSVDVYLNSKINNPVVDNSDSNMDVQGTLRQVTQ